MRVAVYPGSFDPITFGHLDVARRAAAVFDRLVFAVLTNPHKQSLLTVAERLDAIRASVAAIDPTLSEQIDVQSFDGLTVDVCRRAKAGFIVRGLRAISDFETEMQLAHNNRVLAPEIDTVFFMTSVEHGYVSSTLVREIARFGGDVRAMVPAPAETALRVALERVR
ncbi:MAG TPA: pantetheine-phosphate adenylyltransferase [Candidatus Limnocylindrales bacterium]|jgi:pantetheine-phosphate adenylyltransferase